MKPSLSMILPVRDGQGAIGAVIAQAVEVLPELTPRWDLLVIDDGSADATSEVVQELAGRYPQVAVLHHATRRGRTACLRSGVQRTRGDVLLLRSEDCDLDLIGIHKMWKRVVANHDVVIARGQRQVAGKPLAGLPTRLSLRAAGGPALQMVRRRVLHDWAQGTGEEDLQQFLARQSQPRQEVELRRTSSPGPLGSRGARQGAPHSQGIDRFTDRAETSAGPKPPNYLARLKAFAWGE